MTDLEAASVLFVTAATMLAAGRILDGTVRRALWALGVNVAAVAAIFLAFGLSIDAGIAVRPWAKAVDGAAAVIAAFAVHRLAAD